MLETSSEDLYLFTTQKVPRVENSRTKNNDTLIKILAETKNKMLWVENCRNLCKFGQPF